MNSTQSRRTLTGDCNQCPTCGEYFNSISAFDKHRTGDYTTGRHCMTVAEMEAAGMVKSAKDFWLTRARSRQSISSPTRKTNQPRSEVGRYYPTSLADRGSNAKFARRIALSTTHSPVGCLP